MDYNPLQYFEEEYYSFQDTVNDVNSILLHFRDLHSKISIIQKRITTISFSADSSSQDLSSLLSLLSEVLSLSSDLVDSIHSVKSSITFR